MAIQICKDLLGQSGFCKGIVHICDQIRSGSIVRSTCLRHGHNRIAGAYQADACLGWRRIFGHQIRSTSAPKCDINRRSIDCGHLKNAIVGSTRKVISFDDIASGNTRLGSGGEGICIGYDQAIYFSRQNG